MIYSYPFESLNTGTEQEPVYDRAITAEQERMFNKLRYVNGVFNPDAGSLKVTANNNMTVSVAAGGCHIEGALFFNDAPITLNIEAANATLNRIDRVVAQFNTSVSVRAINIIVRTGVAATNPVPQELRRAPNLYEIALADIYVKKGASSIAQSAITDQRMNSNLCGQVVPAIPVPLDLTGIYDQYQTSLNEWLDTVAAALDGTLAGNLQNQIDDLKEKMSNTVGQKNALSIPFIAAHYLGETAQTGKLIIKMPQGFVGTMVKFTVEILGHYGESLAEYDVLGQIYSGGGGSWASVSKAIARGTGPLSNLPVAFGAEGGKCAIAIGELTTKWNTYTAIKIKDFTGYFTKYSFEEWSTGWDISVGTPTGTYTITRERPADYQVSAATEKMFADAGYPIT